MGTKKSAPLKVRWHRAVAESDLPAHLKLTAWALETAMNPDGWGYGRRETFARYANQSESTLSHNVRKIHDLGWVDWQAGNGRGHASEVQATIPEAIKGVVGDALSNGERVSLTNGKGVVDAVKGVVGDLKGVVGDTTRVKTKGKAKESKGNEDQSVEDSLSSDSLDSGFPSPGDPGEEFWPNPGERSCADCGETLEANKLSGTLWYWICDCGWYRRSDQEEEVLAS